MVAKRRILIVEDDQIVQLHLRTILEDLGYEVTDVAESFDQALASADRLEPHAVIMDVRLSGSPDGIEAARALRERHGLDVVFLTAYADEETVGRAEGVGAAAYLVKPFSKPQLRAALSTVFARHAGPRAATSDSARPFGAGTRVAIYSHDTLGLGHLQRNLNLCWALTARFPGLSILLLTGSAVQHQYEMPPGVDTIKLPSVRKVAADRYEARSLSMGAADVRELRSDLVLRAVQSFDPHVLLVDHAPIGMGGELLPTLEWLQAHRPGSVRIAGLRDIWDAPEKVARTWERQRIAGVLEELYTHIVIYGSPHIYDATREYGFSRALCAKASFCGFVGRWRPAESFQPAAREPRARPLVVVTIGGGDGAGEEVLGGWMRMLRARDGAVPFDSVLLTGPFVEPELAERLRGESGDLPIEIQGFVASTRRYLERSDLVVCTGGYNTMVETASFASRALVLPRRLHREEQAIRARVFAEHGLVSTLDVADATPQRLAAVVDGLLDDPARPLERARAEGRLPLDGALRFAEFCSRLEVRA